MRKTLLTLALTAAMALAAGMSFAGDDDNKPKKGKLGGKLDTDKMFAKMNPDKDGKVSKENFEKAFGNLGSGKLGGFAGRIFDRLDTDKDGKLTKEEFAKFGGGLGGLGGLGGGKGDLREKLKGLLDKRKGKGDNK